MSSKVKSIALAISIVGLTAFSAEKIYTLKFSEAALNNHFNNLNTIKAIIEKSNLPHQEVMFVTSSIDSLQRDIIKQVQTQAEPAIKK